ncbi:hypothetical protein [Stenotrophomonas maltophilia group sp. Smal35]|uniref:hypothetical protein n=1 Tax=Stenotrophomonas maltophilia group sp. Smal35 TaxID=3377163 RepID=UPI002555E1DE|nr:hypothetical protein [Stenotrophomonas maltophilia]
MLGHVVDFIKPDFSEPFQLAFFTIILGAAVATLVGVWRTARPGNWKANWEGAGRGNTGLDVDHGSFNDVCDAVATKPEKYAEIVPGLLLIFGLLGTFVGLGIALDSASSILRNANAQNALDGGMGNLLEMMGGLGTKFRTSTWGILGFLLVKLVLAGMGRETQRQQWVIARMKLEMDRARLAGEHLEEQRSQRMQDALSEVAVQMDGSLDQRLQQDRGLRLAHHESTADMMQQAVQALGLQFIAALDEDRILRLQADRVAAEQLTVMLGEAFTQLQQCMQAGQAAQRAVAEQAAQALEALLAKQEQGNDIALDTQQVLMEFTAAQKAFSVSIQHSADTMSAAASNMNDAAEHVSGVIAAFDDGVRSTLGTIKEELGGTIERMDTSLRDSVSAMAGNLGTIASGLSSSIAMFTEESKQTLGEVSKSIETSSHRQQQGLESLKLVTDAAQESIAKSTNYIKANSIKIKTGLKAVSTAARSAAEVGAQLKVAHANLELVGETLHKVQAAMQRDGNEGQQLREVVIQGAKRVVDAHQGTDVLLRRQADNLEALNVELRRLVQPKVADEAELAG